MSALPIAPSPEPERRTSRFAKIDAHVHVPGDKTAALKVLDELNVEKVVNISYSQLGEPEEIESFEQQLLGGTEPYPERYLFCSTFNVTRFNRPDYAEQAIAKLERDFTVRKAVAVKVWKDVGMLLKDDAGRYVFCDDERFSPLFAWLNRRRTVVYLHMADPIAAWQPLEPKALRYSYYSEFPEFHWYGKSDRPSLEELLEHRDALVRSWPDIRFVCAHLASLAHDIDGLAAFLEAHPNAYADTAARQVDLMAEPDQKVRDFFTRCQDRILWGTDWSPRPDLFGQDRSAWPAIVAKIARSFQENFRYFEERLALPEPVLRKFYLENAAALLGLKSP
jgi:predicted TIM-barrel fold metal-dependent hydrolase